MNVGEFVERRETVKELDKLLTLCHEYSIASTCMRTCIRLFSEH